MSFFLIQLLILQQLNSCLRQIHQVQLYFEGITTFYSDLRWDHSLVSLEEQASIIEALMPHLEVFLFHSEYFEIHQLTAFFFVQLQIYVELQFVTNSFVLELTYSSNVVESFQFMLRVILLLIQVFGPQATVFKLQVQEYELVRQVFMPHLLIFLLLQLPFLLIVSLLHKFTLEFVTLLPHVLR